MKTLLVLGGGKKSLQLIKYAKNKGHKVLLCDRDPHCPCRELADEFIKVNTIDHWQIVKEVAKYSLDGVLSFGSDVNAVSAANIAAELELPGNPPNSVLTMVRKDLFREFLASNGFFCPRHESLITKIDILKLQDKFSLPIIIKPVDSAGSNGVTKINSWKMFDNAFRSAQTESKSRSVLVEEFIERRHPQIIGGDIFVQDGHIVFWGLLDSRRDSPWAPFLPTGTSFPASLTIEERKKVEVTLSNLITALGIKFGGLNVELMFDMKGKLYVIELAPRNGGNQIPELLKIATGADLIAALVDTALGEKVLFSEGLDRELVANYMLHSKEPGIYNGVNISPDISSNIVSQEIYVKNGEAVNAFHKATDSFGVITLRFESDFQAASILTRINDLVKINISTDQC